MSSVKLREWSVLLSPAGGTEGVFVHRHLAPITARQNSFSAAGRRVNGPGVGCEERPCPHTPNQGSRVNRSPLMWRMRFLQPLAGEGTPGQSLENVIQLGGQLASVDAAGRGWLRRLGADGRLDRSQSGTDEGQSPPPPPSHIH